MTKQQRGDVLLMAYFREESFSDFRFRKLINKNHKVFFMRQTFSNILCTVKRTVLKGSFWSFYSLNSFLFLTGK